MTLEEIRQGQEKVKDIRGHHFNLGNGSTDYRTTNNQTYNFDKDLAQKSKGMLKEELLNDLRSTHYKLGYDQLKHNQTSSLSAYAPIQLANTGRSNVSDQLKKSSIVMNTTNASQVSRSIYMTDYIQK